jgi:hypothetical protein
VLISRTNTYRMHRQPKHNVQPLQQRGIFLSCHNNKLRIMRVRTRNSMQAQSVCACVLCRERKVTSCIAYSFVHTRRALLSRLPSRVANSSTISLLRTRPTRPQVETKMSAYARNANTNHHHALESSPRSALLPPLYPRNPFGFSGYRVAADAPVSFLLTLLYLSKVNPIYCNITNISA